MWISSTQTPGVLQGPPFNRPFDKAQSRREPPRRRVFRADGELDLLDESRGMAEDRRDQRGADAAAARPPFCKSPRGQPEVKETP